MGTSGSAATPADVRELARWTQRTFERIHRDVFLGDPAVNPRLTVEVVDPELVHDTPTLVLIAPWTLNGLAFPPTGDPPQHLVVGGRRLPVFTHELEALGPYWLVNLVSDVSRLDGPSAARHAAQVFGAPFRRAVRTLREQGDVPDPGRRRLIGALHL